MGNEFTERGNNKTQQCFSAHKTNNVPIQQSIHTVNKPNLSVECGMSFKQALNLPMHKCIQRGKNLPKYKGRTTKEN